MKYVVLSCQLVTGCGSPVSTVGAALLPGSTEPVFPVVLQFLGCLRHSESPAFPGTAFDWLASMSFVVQLCEKDFLIKAFYNVNLRTTQSVLVNLLTWFVYKQLSDSSA